MTKAREYLSCNQEIVIIALFLCGLPSSGKTTLRNYLLKTVNFKEEGIEYVTVVNNDEVGGDKKLSLRYLHYFLDKTVAAQRNYELRRGEDIVLIILDNTFSTRDQRRYFMSTIINHITTVHGRILLPVCVYCTADLETCLERNKKRTDVDNKKSTRAIRIANSKFEPPELSLDGFDSIYTI